MGSRARRRLDFFWNSGTVLHRKYSILEGKSSFYKAKSHFFTCGAILQGTIVFLARRRRDKIGFSYCKITILPLKTPIFFAPAASPKNGNPVRQLTCAPNPPFWSPLRKDLRWPGGGSNGGITLIVNSCDSLGGFGFIWLAFLASASRSYISISIDH